MPSTTPINIHVGVGNIWVGVTVPSAGNFVPLVSGDPTTGTFVGSTLEPATFSHKPKLFDIRTQQSTGVVGFVIVEDELTVEFTVGEITYTNLKNVILGFKDQGTFVSIGGTIIPVLQSLLIVAPKRSGGGANIEAMIYSAVIAEDKTFQFNREGHLAVKVTARSQADTTRSLGDQFGFIHPNVISS